MCVGGNSPGALYQPNVVALVVFRFDGRLFRGEGGWGAPLATAVAIALAVAFKCPDPSKSLTSLMAVILFYTQITHPLATTAKGHREEDHNTSAQPRGEEVPEKHIYYIHIYIYIV